MNMFGVFLLGIVFGVALAWLRELIGGGSREEEAYNAGYDAGLQCIVRESLRLGGKSYIREYSRASNHKTVEQWEAENGYRQF